MPDADMHGPCWPWCRQFLSETIRLEIKRIEAILDEREKATVLLARTEAAASEAAIMEKYVEKEAYDREIRGLQEQLTGPLGLELRMRTIEQAKGSLDAKLYMILVGIPIGVSSIMYVIMKHVFGGG